MTDRSQHRPPLAAFRQIHKPLVLTERNKKSCPKTSGQDRCVFQFASQFQAASYSEMRLCGMNGIVESSVKQYRM